MRVVFFFGGGVRYISRVFSYWRNVSQSVVSVDDIVYHVLAKRSGFTRIGVRFSCFFCFLVG